MKHIAIFRQPFFDMILRGSKTIESRWSLKKIAPYQKVKKGDVILLKQSGKMVTATAKVKDVKYFELTPSIADYINEQWGKQIGIEYFDNWEAFRRKKYCTLIWLEEVKCVEPFEVKKSNGSGWLVVK